MAIAREYHIRRHFETKHHDKFKDLDVSQRRQKLEEMKRSLVLWQSMFKKTISQSEAAVKASFIVAAEISKQSRPFNEGEFVKKYTIKVYELMCSEKKQVFSNVSLSRNTVADRTWDLAANLYDQLMEKEKILLHPSLLWMRTSTHLILPSWQSSSMEWTH